MIEQYSRSLPPAVLYPATALLFLLLLRAILKTPHPSGRLLLVIVWLRYVMQAYHDITYQSFGGVSINAMGSLGVVLVGAYVLRAQARELLRFPIILGLIAVIVVSGMTNGMIKPTIETVLKWGYFLIVLLAVLDCIRRDGDARIFGLLIWAFATPLVFQALSIALGIGKAGESDGSTSFIGGYDHEAAFSVVLVTCFAVVSFAPRLNPAVRIGLLAACLAGIYAANYRTSFIAVAPIAAGYFVFGIARAGSPGRRLAVSLIGFLIVVGAAVGANMLLAERLNDLTIAASGTTELIRPPDEFTLADQRLLSGRLYLWSRYIDEYLSGSDRQLLFGFGPDSWVEIFQLYAHNTIISYLFEFGMAGAVLIVLVWLAMLLRTLRVRDGMLRGQLFCAHVGFVLLNMATMPFWLIEGLIFYGLLCGYTVCVSQARIRKPLLRNYIASERLTHVPDWWVDPAPGRKTAKTGSRAGP